MRTGIVCPRMCLFECDYLIDDLSLDFGDLIIEFSHFFVDYLDLFALSHNSIYSNYREKHENKKKT